MASGQACPWLRPKAGTCRKALWPKLRSTKDERPFLFIFIKAFKDLESALKRFKGFKAKAFQGRSG